MRPSSLIVFVVALLAFGCASLTETPPPTLPSTVAAPTDVPTDAHESSANLGWTNATPASEPGYPDLSAVSVGEGVNYDEEALQRWRDADDLLSCEELEVGWTSPILGMMALPGSAAAEGFEFEGRGAVLMYVESYVSYAYIDPRHNAEILPDTARARIADHLTSLIDGDGLYCGYVRADRYQLAALRQSVPVLPSGGNAADYSAWAKNRCFNAVAMARSLRDEIALTIEAGDSEALSSIYGWEHAPWLSGHPTFAGQQLATGIEERDNVPRAAFGTHETMREVARQLDRAIDQYKPTVLDAPVSTDLESVIAALERVETLCDLDIPESMEELVPIVLPTASPGLDPTLAETATAGARSRH